MAHGFFTIEQWRGKKWQTICHLDATQSLAAAVNELKRRDKTGFFRIVQTQRMIWAEKSNGRLHLHKWHAGNPETLSRSTKAFDRDGGK
jgi:hypothetical protein